MQIFKNLTIYEVPNAIIFSAASPVCGDVEAAIHLWNTVSKLNAR